MEQKTEKIWADGMRFEKPAEGAPSFIKGKISIKVADFIAFLQKHENGGGWVNIDLKKSNAGKLYLELNQYKRKEVSEDDDIV